MRSLTSYDYPSITRNVSGHAWRWVYGRRVHVLSLVRIQLGLALFWVITATCAFAIGIALALYALSVAVLPREHARNAEWLE